MRLSEAINLELEDVNFNDGYLLVQEAKGWKERKVYLSDELISMLKEYNQIISFLLPERKYFFPTNTGDKKIGKATIDNWFREISVIAFKDIPLVGNKRRIHDFRHTFATERLSRWVEDGIDINQMYPFFSRYLGHTHYTDTDYYIQLVPAFYSTFNNLMTDTNNTILPEVIDDDKE